jgi:hypothetical protein
MLAVVLISVPASILLTLLPLPFWSWRRGATVPEESPL